MLRRTLTLTLIFLFVSIASSLEEKVITMYFSIYRNDTLNMKYMGIERGLPTNFPNVTSEYWLTLLSENGKCVYFVYLPITFKMIDEGSEQGVITVDRVDVYYRIPWREEARRIEIYHEGILLFSADVPKEGCGDGSCNIRIGENYLTCPQDCPSGGEDDYCDGVKDGICDPDCVKLGMAEKDQDCRKRRPITVLYIFLTVLIVVLVFLIYRRTRQL